MKKTLLVVVLALVILAPTLACDEVEPSWTTEIRVENGSVHLSGGVGGGSYSPMSLYHLEPSVFWTIDSMTDRLVEIRLPDSLVPGIELSGAMEEFGWSQWVERWDGDTIIGSAVGRHLTAWDTKTAEDTVVFAAGELYGGDGMRRIEESGGRGDYIVVCNTLFYRDAEPKVRAISPDGELLSHEEALVLMDTVNGNPEETYSQLHPVIAARNRELRDTGQHYVVGGRYYTTEWNELKEYLDSIERARDWREAEDERSYWDVRNTLPLLGYDQYHNSYWGTGPSVTVLSPTGQTLGIFSLVDLVRESPVETSMGVVRLHVTGWHLDPDGTAWALAFRQDTPYSESGTIYIYRFDSIAERALSQGLR